MSDKTRIALTDDEVEAVAGGNIRYALNKNEAVAWGTHNPDKKYGIISYRRMIAFVDENYDLYGEAGTLDKMVEAGILFYM